MYRCLATIALMIMSSTAGAAAYCTERLTNLIVKTDGAVYFTTNSTCPNWCQLNFSAGAAKSQGYAMLLAAMSTDRDVRFYWLNISSCSSINATNSSPDHFYISSP